MVSETCRGCLATSPAPPGCPPAPPSLLQAFFWGPLLMECRSLPLHVLHSPFARRAVPACRRGFTARARSRAGFCPRDAGWGGDVSAALLRPFPRGLSGVLQISWQHLTAKLLVRHFSAWITADAQDVPVPSNSLFITQPKKTIYFFSRTGTFSKHGSPGGCAWSCPQPAEPWLPRCRGGRALLTPNPPDAFLTCSSTP